MHACFLVKSEKIMRASDSDVFLLDLHSIDVSENNISQNEATRNLFV